MNFLNWLNSKINSDFSIRGLIRLVLLLLVIMLVEITSGFWLGILRMIWNILKPFAIGFVIAYIIHDPMKYLESRGISRKIVIPVIYLLLLGFAIWLAYSIIPLVITRADSFINSVIASVNWLNNMVSSHTPGGSPEWFRQMINSGISALTDMQALIPGISGMIPDLLTGAIGALVITIISVVISIFYCFEWEKIKYYVAVLSRRVSRRFFQTVFEVNDEIGDYIRSVLKLIFIRLFEYALLYFLVGHPDWLILAIATAVSLIIPYVGPIAVNTIGILTALQLPTTNLIILIVMICLLSQLDEYVITPMVHSRNLHISPLWALFSIFAGNTVLGIRGIIIAIPCYLAIRVIFRKYTETADNINDMPPTKETL